MAFYYNPYKGELASQWIDYIQTRSYIDDIGNIITYNRKQLEYSINSATDRIRDDQNAALKHICGSIDRGFQELSYHLKDIGYSIASLRGEISEMASMLDWKLSQMIEAQRITNVILGRIANLIMVPEQYKIKVFYLEEGFKYLKNAYLGNTDRDYFELALNNFKEAKNHGPIDYITLNAFGQIHLYSKNYLDFSLARKYFVDSAVEAMAESLAKGTTVSNNVSVQGYGQMIYSNDRHRAAAAESYVYAARACYLQKNLSEATELSSKAFDLIPDFHIAGFEKAKYLAANNKITEAVNLLRTIINKDRYFSVKVLTDQDLASKPAVLSFLNELQQKAISEANAGLSRCKDIMHSESNAKDKVYEIDKIVKENTFLSGKKAIDILNADHSFNYHEYEISSWNKEDIDEHRRYFTGKIVDFLKLENKSRSEFGRLHGQGKEHIIRTRAWQAAGIGAIIGVIIGFFQACSCKPISLDILTWIITTLICTLLGAAIGLLIGYSKEPKIDHKNY